MAHIQTSNRSPNDPPNDIFHLISITNFLLRITFNLVPSQSPKNNKNNNISEKNSFFSPKTQKIFQTVLIQNAAPNSLLTSFLASYLSNVNIEKPERLFSTSMAVLVKNLSVLSENKKNRNDLVEKLANLCFSERGYANGEFWAADDGWLETLRFCVGKENAPFVWFGNIAEDERFGEFLVGAFTDFKGFDLNLFGFFVHFY